MVLLAVLATTEFFDPFSIPRRLPTNVWMPVQANGRSFWHCLYLACVATQRERFFWIHRQRNAAGFPDQEAAFKEDNKVVQHFEGIEDMPEETKHRMISAEPTIPQDMVPCFVLQ